MCGRYTLLLPPAELARRFRSGLRLTGDGPTGALPERPRYNVGPGQDVPVIRASRTAGGRIMEARRWGFVPYWLKPGEPGPRPINARSETVATKPMFRDAFARRRCLVPATGYFEWYRGPTGEGPPRRAYYLEVAGGEPFAIAGLYAEGGLDPPAPHGTCLVLTTTPNAVQAPIHDRMPVILPESAWDFWLDAPPTELPALINLLKPCPAEHLRCREVSSLVNDARRDDPAVLRGPDDPATWGDLFSGLPG